MRILGEYDRVLEATLDEDGTVTFTCDADYLPKPKGVTLTLSQVQGAILELCGMWSEGRRQEDLPEYQHPEDPDAEVWSYLDGEEELAPARPVCPKCGTAGCLEDKALDW